jgi:GDPmannose 4,6-dehydratase
MLGDSSYARKMLGWKPTVSFPELVRMMLESDIASIDTTAAGEHARRKS